MFAKEVEFFPLTTYRKNCSFVKTARLFWPAGQPRSGRPAQNSIIQNCSQRESIRRQCTAAFLLETKFNSNSKLCRIPTQKRISPLRCSKLECSQIEVRPINMISVASIPIVLVVYLLSSYSVYCHVPTLQQKYIFLSTSSTSTTRDVIEEAKCRADLLVKLLRERFKDHVRDRIDKKEKRSGWVMKMAFKNLIVDAAHMVLARQVKDDLSCIQENDCILAATDNNFIPCITHPKRQGVYAYYDRNRGAFVRDGKVTRRGFDARGGEHWKGARASKPSSNFYMMYPAKSADRPKMFSKQRYFENLNHDIIAGFDPTSELANCVDKDISEGGIMLLSECEKGLIKESMKTAEGRRDLTNIQKFQDVLSYQKEFGGDLAMSPLLNVSESAGFEALLGVFGGKKK